jgi:hypothetical protein
VFLRVLKRTAIVARLFYHTAMCLLYQMNPMAVNDTGMYEVSLHHAQEICGIVVHVKDRSVLRCECSVTG